MPGPVSKHPSVRNRRNDPRNDFRTLPSAGRPGAIPDWPLQPDARMVAELEFSRDRIASLQLQVEEETDGRKKGRLRRQLDKLQIAEGMLAIQLEHARDAELALWSEMWATPQAILWEETRSGREVAQYVRWKIRAEQGDVAAAREARQLSSLLGLTPLALLRMKAEIEKKAEQPGTSGGSTPRRRPVKKGPKGDDPRNGLYAVS